MGALKRRVKFLYEGKARVLELEVPETATGGDFILFHLEGKPLTGRIARWVWDLVSGDLQHEVRLEDVWETPEWQLPGASNEVSTSDADTGPHDRAMNEIDRRYVTRLLDSCEANYDELPQGLKNVIGQLRTAGLRDRLHRLKTHGDPS